MGLGFERRKSYDYGDDGGHLTGDVDDHGDIRDDNSRHYHNNTDK